MFIPDPEFFSFRILQDRDPPLEEIFYNILFSNGLEWESPNNASGFSYACCGFIFIINESRIQIKHI
jgi:hypothetical protein